MGVAMSEYRKKAEECLRAAERMRDPGERIEMLGIACGYMSLDDLLEATHKEAPIKKGGVGGSIGARPVALHSASRWPPSKYKFCRTIAIEQQTRLIRKSPDR
jgi:hypothetical protein